MKDIRNFLANYEAATSGFSKGRLKNNSGSGDGSLATKEYLNDLLYCAYSLIKKYKTGDISDTNESELAPDFITALEEMTAIQINGIEEWSGSGNYDLDEAVTRYGIQFISLVGSNISNDPLLKPNFWLPCLSFSEAFNEFQKGNVKEGGLHRIHDYRDTGNYRQVFPYGTYNIGGVSGKTFQAYGVHLDNTVITGDTFLEDTVFKVGVAGEYHLIDTIAPIVVTTRTLMDARGRTARIVDDSTDTEDIGVVQADAFQGHDWYLFRDAVYNLGITNDPDATVCNQRATSDVFDYILGFNTTSPYTSATLGKTNGGLTNNATDGTPRTDDETRMKNYTVGVPYVIVINEVP